MIPGLDLFREFFADYRKAFVLIGGVACNEWLSTQGRTFRATKDMDMVLIVEAVDGAFVKRFWEFIEAGRYQGRFKAEDGRQLYRFDKPEDEKYPVMIEIFSRKPSNIDLGEGQTIVPVRIDEDSGSLSAILMNDDYYDLVKQQHDEEKNLPFANAAALIPLKARAHLDLAARASKGEEGKSKDISKHRTDVFRIAAALPGGPGPEIPTPIREDLRKFLSAFPLENKREWEAICAGLKSTGSSGQLKPETLIEAMRVYFRL